MARGGYREGAGRKSNSNSLKTGTFRLSIDEIKLIDKKGIGKSSSEKLRYIIKNFLSEKIGPKKYKSAYFVKKFNDFKEGKNLYNTIFTNWEQKSKNELLIRSKLSNYIKDIIKFELLKKIEKMDIYIKLKKQGWFIQFFNLSWNDSCISNYSIAFAKSDINIVLPINSEDDIDYNEQENRILEKEQYLIENFYEDLELNFETFTTISDFEYTSFSKKYSNDDIYMNVEYENLIVMELNYFASINKLELAFVKELEL